MLHYFYKLVHLWDDNKRTIHFISLFIILVEAQQKNRRNWERTLYVGALSSTQGLFKTFICIKTGCTIENIYISGKITITTTASLVSCCLCTLLGLFRPRYRCNILVVKVLGDLCVGLVSSKPIYTDSSQKAAWKFWWNLTGESIMGKYSKKIPWLEHSQ